MLQPVLKKMLHLSLSQARTLLLAAQGLLNPPDAPATKADVLAAIRRMQVLQIDTIHVVARSPYLVLWSRLGDYQNYWLDELLAERAIFEYWAHEACFLPIEDYPLYRRMILADVARPQARAHKWLAANQAAVDELLAYIRANGPVRSADFKRNDGKVGTWWNWKFEKMALEMLYTSGDLMIARRRNFQRVYDLRERLLPDWDDSQAPPLDAVRRELALRALQALGVAPARWVADYFRTAKRDTQPLPAQLAAEGLVQEVAVEGWSEPGYLHPVNRELAEAIVAGSLRAERTTLLSPFDPLVWDRARALELFGFEYRIECYTPAPKRRYGYFTLPILHQGRLVGRLDPKAHRADGVFEVKALHFEPGAPFSDELVAGLAAALRACAAWHRTPELVLRHCDPPEMLEPLRRALAE